VGAKKARLSNELELGLELALELELEQIQAQMAQKAIAVGKAIRD
jgi:hypothetical protein